MPSPSLLIWHRVGDGMTIPCRCLAALLLFGMASAGAEADEEAGNLPHVQSDSWGRCYAKSVPKETYGEAGTTRVYEVGPTEDRLLATYDWFSQQIDLQCSMVRGGENGVSVVKIGPWPRGHAASADHLALAFYFNDRLLKRYSTLDLAGRADNVQASVSHYMVVERIDGYRWIDGNRYAFDVRTVDGRTLSFDPTTGELTGAPQ